MLSTTQTLFNLHAAHKQFMFNHFHSLSHDSGGLFNFSNVESCQTDADKRNTLIKFNIIQHQQNIKCLCISMWDCGRDRFCAIIVLNYAHVDVIIFARQLMSVDSAKEQFFFFFFCLINSAKPKQLHRLNSQMNMLIEIQNNSSFGWRLNLNIGNVFNFVCMHINSFGIASFLSYSSSVDFTFEWVQHVACADRPLLHSVSHQAKQI